MQSTKTLSSLKQGFSLVELSIVLVILGLLIGGILSGQSLIRAAELRSVSTDMQRYATSIYTFRDKYFAMPGDMTNATSFWGHNASACNTHGGAATANGTCNGNGNGAFDGAYAVGATSEWFQFWHQLELAGLIEGSYTGLIGTGSTDAVLGTNVPRGRISSTGFSVATWDNTAGVTDPWNFAVNFGSHFIFGTLNSTASTSGAALKPGEAWNIDTKMDDGKPALGKFIVHGWGTCGNGSSATDFSASYRLDSESVVCAVRIRF